MLLLEKERLSRSRVISLDITEGSFKQVQNEIVIAALERRRCTVCFANAHMTVEAARDQDFAKMVNGANWVVPDGAPIVWTLRKLYGRQQERISGPEFLPNLLQRAASEELSVYFYGSTPEVLSATLDVCHQKYPSLRIAGVHSPPFRPLTLAEEEEDVRRIVASGARLVFVALGCPKQEVWISRMRHRIPAVLMGIGGALPILAGCLSRAPRWMQDSGLEWLYRLAQEPGRLFYRYMTTNTLFVLYLIRSQLRTRRLGRFSA